MPFPASRATASASCAATPTRCSASTWRRLLHASQKPLERAAEAASRAGSLDVINDIESARKKLDRVTARVRAADRGYSGFFDPVKVDEQVLGRVYQFDLDSLGGAQAIAAVAAKAGSGAARKEEVQAVIDAIAAFEERWGQREGILRAVL